METIERGLSTSSAAEKTTRPFGFLDKISYMFGDFGCNMSFSLVQGYFMLFYVTVVGIDPVHYGFVILGTKIWDGINDPLIGALTDYLKPKGGKDKFRPWIFWTSFPISLATALMFAFVPGMPYWLKLTQCIVTYLIWDICYTCINVPYGSLQSVITSDPVERAELSRFRTLGSFVAMIGLQSLLPKIVYVDGNPVGGRFFLASSILAVVGFISYQILYKFSVERVKIVEVKTEEKFNYFKTFKAFFKNRPMVALTIASVSTLLLVGSTSTMNQYVFITYFKEPSLLSLGAIISLAPTLFAMVFVKAAVKRFGKKAISSWPVLGSVLCYVVLLISPIDNPYLWFSMQGLGALLSGFYSMLTWAMVSDCIDYQEWQTGRREEGSIYATYSLFRKFAQGFGASLIAFLLALTGYKAALGADQIAGVAENIKLLAILLPLAGNVVIFLVMKFVYNLGNKELEKLEHNLGRNL